jgi:hypothetical protein
MDIPVKDVLIFVVAVLGLLLINVSAVLNLYKQHLQMDP